MYDFIAILIGFVGWISVYYFYNKYHDLNANIIKSDYEHYREMEKMQEMYETMTALYQHDIATRDDVIEKYNLEIFYDIKEKK